MLDKDRLRLSRLKLRLTQEKLGGTIGQDQSYISRLERGDFTEITVTTLERLADALHVSTDYLLGREDDRSEALPPVAPPVAAAPAVPRRRRVAQAAR
jgi:transcriptional regulator with XRE-family HTH domain